MHDSNGVEIRYRDRVRVLTEGKGVGPEDVGLTFRVNGFNSRRRRAFLVRTDIPRGSHERLTRHADPSTLAVLRRDGEDGYEQPDTTRKATPRAVTRGSQCQCGAS